ncbi:pentalenolactone synthase [Tamaricihabitans halophyticus]|uniref:Pentalenolactone synthase n=1 Tax=Tamaricihabitans halophyticus TaxID=1262583 RepID=A0A4R2R0K2_9PSEU|nr:cytochrome P450 [Tamaricihabitans halophyticus]TCP56162.1 pentalenolactone synthase [Tamaricihabitans halophyticus]
MTGTIPYTLPFSRPRPLDPPPEYARLRESAPVAKVFAMDGAEAWLVTSYEAAASALADRRLGVAPLGYHSPDNNTLFQDGHTHARLRRLVAKAFTARSIRELRIRIDQLAARQVTELAAERAPRDLVAGLGAPLSIGVISELLGVDIAERAHFQALTDAMSAYDPTLADGADPELAAAPWLDFCAYMAELIAAKRASLGSDLLSSLIEVSDDADGRLTEAELVGMATAIVAGGYQTASNALAVGVLRLLSGPGLEAGADEAVVEESLRMLGGRTGEPFPRFAHQDLELAGVAIAEGERVLVRVEAANRDPRQFAEPDEFRAERFRGERRTPPLTFGHGQHFCLGANLARAELAAVLQALGAQLPGLRLVGSVTDLEWREGGTDAGPVAVPVTWD